MFQVDKEVVGTGIQAEGPAWAKVWRSASVRPTLGVTSPSAGVKEGPGADGGKGLKRVANEITFLPVNRGLPNVIHHIQIPPVLCSFFFK